MLFPWPALVSIPHNDSLSRHMLERIPVSCTFQFDDPFGIYEFATRISDFGFVTILFAFCFVISLTRFAGHRLRRLGLRAHVRTESFSLHASMWFLCALCFAIALALCVGQRLRRLASLTHNRFCKIHTDDILGKCGSIQIFSTVHSHLLWTYFSHCTLYVVTIPSFEWSNTSGSHWAIEKHASFDVWSRFSKFLWRRSYV